MSPNTKRWTMKEIDFLRQNLTMSVDELMIHLPKRTERAIKLKIMEYFGPDHMENNKAEIIEDYVNKKRGLFFLSKKYGVGPKSISPKLLEWGVEVRTRSKRSDVSGSNNCNWTGCGEISGSKYNNIKKDATRRNMDFFIPIEYLWELFLKQERKCAVSGELLFMSTQRRLCTASLDRKDYLKGYTEDNIQWVHKTINIMKNRFSDEEFMFWCNKVVNYNNVRK